MNVPKQVSLRKSIALLISVLLLASGVFYYVWAATPSATFYVSPGSYPGAPTFTIWRDGSNYFAKDENGEIAYNGNNASTVINAALSSVTSGVFYFQPGIYSISVPLILDGRSKTILGEVGGIDTSTTTTKFYLANSANCHVFVVGSTAGTLARDMKFKHFTIEANQANNPTGGAGIFINYSAAGNHEEGYIEDVMIFDAQDYGFSVNAGYWTLIDTTTDSCQAGGYYINGTDTYILDGDAYSNAADGFRFDVGAVNTRVTDTRAYLNTACGFNATAEHLSFIGCRAGSNGDDGFYCFNMNQSRIASCESTSNTGDGISFISSSYKNSITSSLIWNNGGSGILIDSSGVSMAYQVEISNNIISFSQEHGIKLAGCRDSILVGNEVVDSSRKTNGGYYGIWMTNSGTDYAAYDVLSGNKVRDYSGNKAARGIYESNSNMDYNMYIGCQVMGQTSAPILLAGTHSMCNCTYNGTTWVP